MNLINTKNWKYLFINPLNATWLQQPTRLHIRRDSLIECVTNSETGLIWRGYARVKISGGFAVWRSLSTPSTFNPATALIYNVKYVWQSTPQKKLHLIGFVLSPKQCFLSCVLSPESKARLAWQNVACRVKSINLCRHLTHVSCPDGMRKKKCWGITTSRTEVPVHETVKAIWHSGEESRTSLNLDASRCEFSTRLFGLTHVCDATLLEWRLMWLISRVLTKERCKIRKESKCQCLRVNV